MDLSRDPEEKPEGARAPKQDPALRAFSPQGSSSGGQSAPPKDAKQEPRGDSIRIKVPLGLRRDSEEKVQYLGYWSSPSEFYREAIRNWNSRWDDEIRRKKRQLGEGGDHNSGD
jgi:Arc/MetJ-type ribon-helix-helix transcriptional regulator